MQLNAHIGNVTAIARKIPVASVASHLYSKLLRDLLDQTDVATGSASNNLKMIGAIHREIPPQISYDSIVEGLLAMLTHPPSTYNGVDDGESSETRCKSRAQLVKKLRGIIRSLSDELGSAFDGTLLVGALQSSDVTNGAWSARDEEDKARLMFQCITMSASPFLESFERSTLSSGEQDSLRKSLSAMRRSLLEWCCFKYGPNFGLKLKRKRLETDFGESPGAGEPIYSSVLGPPSDSLVIPPWLIFMRCLLLLEDPDSASMKRFIFPEFTNADESVWTQEIRLLRVCCCFGRDLSDEPLWIVLKSSRQKIDPEMAIQILEHLLQGCGRKSSGMLAVSDPKLIWEMYDLVLFSPPAPLSIMSTNTRELDDASDYSRAGRTAREVPRYDHVSSLSYILYLAFRGLNFSSMST